MNFKTTGLLVAVALIIGAVWYLYPTSRQIPEDNIPPKPATEESKNVFDPQPKDDQLVRIELERPGKPKLVFERSDPNQEQRGRENWRMLAPAPALADASKVRPLTSTLATLQSRSRFEAGAKGQPTAAEAGLEPPTATLSAKDKDGKEFKLEIGRKVALSSDTYVRSAGDKLIQVASRELASLVEKNVNEYRAPRPLTCSTDEITRVQLRYEATNYDFSRGAEGEWVINEPVRSYADKTKVRDKLLTPLATLQVVEFLDEQSAAANYGFDEPFLTLALTTETKLPRLPAEKQDSEESAASQPAPVVETRRMLIGGVADLKAQRRYAQLEGELVVAVVNQSVLDGLIPKLNELRDARVLRVKSADITQLDFGVAGSNAVLKKMGGVWQGSGDVPQVDSAAVTQFVEALAGLTAVDYVDQPEGLETYGLDKPRAVLTVTATGVTAPIALRVGGPTKSGRNVYLQREGEPGVLVAAETQVAKIAVEPSTLRSREVLSFPPDRLTRLDVQRGGMHYLLERSAGQWKMTEPADAPLDMGVLNGLCTNLGRLRAASIVAGDNDAALGLEHPALTIRFEVEEAVPPTDTQAATAPATTRTAHTLRFGRVNDKNTYLRMDADPLVFELEDSVYRAISTELINARLFSFEPDKVARIKVTAPGGTLELAKEKNKWVYATDPTVALDQKKVQDFAQDLARLRVEGYLAWKGGDFAAAGLAPAPAAVTITLADGYEYALGLAQEQPGELPRVVGLASEQRICLLKRADAQKLLRGLDEYVVSDKPAAPPGQLPKSPLPPSEEDTD
jgi:hypothetical protein